MGTIAGPLWAGLMSKQVYGFLGLMSGKWRGAQAAQWQRRTPVALPAVPTFVGAGCAGLLVIALAIFIAMYRRLLPDDNLSTLEKRLSMVQSPPPAPQSRQS